MGKETVIFRDTREKVDSRSSRREEGASNRFRRDRNAPVQKKNISKKDSDVKQSWKRHVRIEKIHERKLDHEQNAKLRNLNKGNMDWKEKRAAVM